MTANEPSDGPCGRCGHSKGFFHLHNDRCHATDCGCPGYVEPDTEEGGETR